jgi:hypothetical protein
MTDKKNRERVIAEITLSHLMRLGNEHGCPVSREQALAFLNQEGRAFEMWKHMMQSAEEFIAGRLFQHSFSAGGHKRIRVSASTGAFTSQCHAVAHFRVHSAHVCGCSNLVASLYNLSATSEVSA